MKEICLALFLLSSFLLYYFLKNKLAVFFPSSKEVIKVVIELANLKKDDVFFDLGSGDGRILIEASKSGARVFGVEKNKILNWLAKRKVKKLGLKNVKIIEGDLFKQDLGKATVIVAYLSQFLVEKLERKIEKEVKKGTRIILVDHKFKNLKPVLTRRVGLIPVRLYVK